MTDAARPGSALGYWLDLECLVPAEVPQGRDGTVRRGARAIAWPREDRGGRGHLVRIGVFDVDAAYARLAELVGGALDEAHDRPRPASGFMASFQVDVGRRIVRGSFRASLFAVRFASLPHDGPTPDELRQRRDHLAAAFDEAWGGDGDVLGPGTLSGIEEWLRGKLRQRPPLGEGPNSVLAHVAPIPVGDDGALLEGFHHDELSRVAAALRRSGPGKALASYLSVLDVEDGRRLDADDPGVIAALLDPTLVPPSKWPSRGLGGPPLVLRQQMAANAACAERHGLFAVNGPPGTGKTTLLREVVAAAIAARAAALAEFTEPGDAFSRDDIGGRRAWSLHPSLRGHGILVCSGNNKAVENVTRELPSPDAVAPSYRGDATFAARAGALAGVAAAVGEAPAWGLVSAVLGRAANRRRFAEAFWPARDAGERAILDAPRIQAVGEVGTARNGVAWVDVSLSANGRSWQARAWGEAALRILDHRDGDAPAAGHAVLARPSADRSGARRARGAGRWNVEALHDAPAPRGIADVLSVPVDPAAWGEAVARFRAARRAVEEGIVASIACVEGRDRLKSLDGRVRACADAHARLRDLCERTADDERTALAERAEAHEAHAGAASRLDGLRRERPGLVERMVAPGSLGRWDAAVSGAESALGRAERRLEHAARAALRAGNRHAAAGRDVDAAVAALETARRDREAMAHAFTEAERFLGAERPLSPAEAARLPTHAMEASSPWSTAVLDRAREELFVASMDLHTCFLKAASGPVLDNLRLHLDLIAGRREESAPLAVRGVDLWDTFFLAVPAVSSTFASLGATFGDALPAEGIGWVLVDEAGQARPQDAVGAVWRGRRVVMVGDPRQVEPVNRMPRSVSAFLAGSHGIDNPAFDPGRGSAQAMADRVSTLGAWLSSDDGRTWVGCPLRVHRRCDEPMFGIANAASYGGSMVLGKEGTDYGLWSGTFPAWGPGGNPSCWIDIREARSRSKWGQLGADYAWRMISQMIRQRGLADGLALPDGRPAPSLHHTAEGLPDLYVVSPFTEVAGRFRKLVLGKADEIAGLLPGLPEGALARWCADRIGTVHAFQGGEAPTVMLLLGGNAGCEGAVGWATGRANILNVAVTRARSSLYVIGERGLWLRGAFRHARCLPVRETPAFVVTARDRRAVRRLDSLADHLGELARAFGEARRRVVVCSPFLTASAVSHPVLDVPALVRAAVARGVAVTVYSDARFLSESGRAGSVRAAVESLTKAGAEVRVVHGLHAKTLCVDRSWIVDGSFNWLSAPRDGALARHEASYRHEAPEAAGDVDRAIAALEALPVADAS